MREWKGWDVLEGKFNEKIERLGVLEGKFNEIMERLDVLEGKFNEKMERRDSRNDGKIRCT